MRASWPMPRRTSLMSAPSASHRLAISLMKLILVASMALATYLVISALSGDMTRNGRSVRRKGAYSSCSTSPTSGRRTPTTTRSGFMKSSMAAPSLRNSGLLATSMRQLRACGQALGQLAVGADRHGALDDDDLGVRRRPRRWRRRRPRRLPRSAPPSWPCGVPTAMKMSWAASMPPARSVVKVQPAFAAVALHQLQQARLVDGQLARFQPGDLGARPCRCRRRRCRSRPGRCW